jgi:hypothetical protein
MHCCENFLNKISKRNVKVETPKRLYGNIRLQTTLYRLILHAFQLWDFCGVLLTDTCF